MKVEVARASTAPPSNPVSTGIGYRPGLDGLRGLSLIAIFGFHGGFARAPGAFLSVSTFFTLSGFLNTTLLLSEHARTVSSVSPTTGTKNGGTQVTIRGTNLAGGTVTISGHDARIVSTSSTSIVAVTPAGTAGSTGAIVVTTSGGSINAATYAYLRT